VLYFLNMESDKYARPQYEGLSAYATDSVLEVFKRDIDWTLVERNLKLTTDERAQQLVKATKFISKFRPMVNKKT
jgi:hypothetical protein